MTFTFECDKDVIVYALEKILSFARDNQYILLAQSIWWISSIIRLQQGLIIYIDNLKGRSELRPESSIRQMSPAESEKIQTSDGDYIDSDIESVSTTETNIHNEILNTCEVLLTESKKEWKAIGRLNQQASRIVKRKANKKKPIKNFGTQTEGIDGSELRRQKAAGDCQRRAWPQDRKGSHKTLDCFRWARLEKGTAPFPKKKQKSIV
jgi:hypothetical protein